jgi:acetyl-CoA acetyltransferase
VIIGVGEAPYTRRPAPGTTVEGLLADAARRALKDAGLQPRDVDGLAVASFALAPDRAVDLAWKLGLRLRWIMDDQLGGGTGLNMVAHARRAVDAGDASTVLVVAGDLLADFDAFARGFNATHRDHLPVAGFNPLFAMLTQRHMREYGLSREDYAAIPIAQRAWAAGNPGAVYREPLTLEEYLAAPMVAEPLCRYDCPPVVAGADALVVGTGGGVGIRALQMRVNLDQQEGDGLTTGLADMTLWDEAGLGPADVDVVAVYDDYPAMVLVQLADLGFGGPREVLPRIADRSLALNTSGGMLSAGQAGIAGGLHGLVHAVAALREGRGRTAVVAGYGMAIYRHGAVSNAAVVEAA